MSLPANIRPRVFENRLAHIRRSLLGEGKLLVVKNQEVVPQDILGSFHLSSGFSTVKLAQRLGIAPRDGLKYLVRPVGSSIFKGELLAAKKGLFGQKVVVAPTDGIIEEYFSDRGELRMKFLPKNVQLTSGVFGIIDDVSPKTGEVLIRTVVTEVFGIVGSGKQRGGILQILRGGNLTGSTAITAQMSQHVLVTGSLIYSGALKKAIKIGVNGVITGGINAADYLSIAGSLDPAKNLGSEIGLSLIVAEGFGPIPIGDDISNQLKNHEGRFVFINGNEGRLLLPSGSSDSILLLRKSALPITKSPSKSAEVQMGEIRVGSRVRIIRSPFMGAQGKVLSIDALPTVIESKLPVVLITVETTSRKLKVPYTNIELI